MILDITAGICSKQRPSRGHVNKLQRETETGSLRNRNNNRKGRDELRSCCEDINGSTPTTARRLRL